MVQGARSLAARALLAAALMVGFYLLALGFALGLLYVPYAEWTLRHGVTGKLALFCVVGAGLILWALVPRPDRFAPPGPVLSPRGQYPLLRLIREVAAATGQAMPAEVYLVPEANAWVTQRGGVMGLGSRRVMGLGLPLLPVLTISELRAVLAHEFGHYHGGDTKLGPWIYRTRAAIGRTLASLEEHSSLLQKPFVWYASLFLRVSHAVSRGQELTADALAARTAGARAFAAALKKIHGAALAMSSYWTEEVGPVLRAGFLPPVAEGFQRFLAAERVATAVNGAVEQAAREAEADPYDTHPPLRDRLAALKAFPEGARPAADPPAITLLSGVPELERELLGGVVAGGEHGKLTPIGWSEVGARVYLPFWEALVRDRSAALAGLTLEGLGERARALRSDRAGRPGAGDESDREEVSRADLHALASALALALARAGWSVRTDVGEPIVLQRSADAIDPFHTVFGLASGKVDEDGWRRRCADLGIAGLELVDRPGRR
jgi:Zn-dependent protease with chaperone function